MAAVAARASAALRDRGHREWRSLLLAGIPADLRLRHPSASVAVERLARTRRVGLRAALRDARPGVSPRSETVATGADRERRMRRAVFGATGPTGQEVVREALRRDHEVVAVARRPDAVVAAPGLSVVQADVTDPQSTLISAIKGVDAVLSALDTRGRGPTDVYSLGARRIVEAMNAAGVRRLVCISSEGLEIAPGTPFLQSLATKHVVQRLYRNAYADMREMEAFLASASIDWKVVRAPMLRDGASSASYRVALDQPLPGGGALRRSELAQFMLDCIDQRDTFGRLARVASPKAE
jgi:putative NADH-flavin reductase